MIIPHRARLLIAWVLVLAFARPASNSALGATDLPTGEQLYQQHCILCHGIQLSRMQIDLMVSAFAADFMRVATMQYAYSTGDTVMSWLKIDGRHHDISHKPDSDQGAQSELTRINHWYCEQVAYLAKRLAETPELGGTGSLLDSTTIVWTNELGKGNDHSHENIPFVLVGGGLGFRMGRSLKFPAVPHNRLLLSLAHGFGHELKQFGNSNYCGDGPLPGLMDRTA